MSRSLMMLRKFQIDRVLTNSKLVSMARNRSSKINTVIIRGCSTTLKTPSSSSMVPHWPRATTNSAVERNAANNVNGYQIMKGEKMGKNDINIDIAPTDNLESDVTPDIDMEFINTLGINHEMNVSSTAVEQTLTINDTAEIELNYKCNENDDTSIDIKYDSKNSETFEVKAETNNNLPKTTAIHAKDNSMNVKIDSGKNNSLNLSQNISNKHENIIESRNNSTTRNSSYCNDTQLTASNGMSETTAYTNTTVTSSETVSNTNKTIENESITLTGIEYKQKNGATGEVTGGIYSKQRQYSKKEENSSIKDRSSMETTIAENSIGVNAGYSEGFGENCSISVNGSVDAGMFSETMKSNDGGLLYDTTINSEEKGLNIKASMQANANCGKDNNFTLLDKSGQWKICSTKETTISENGIFLDKQTTTKTNQIFGFQWMDQRMKNNSNVSYVPSQHVQAATYAFGTEMVKTAIKNGQITQQDVNKAFRFSSTTFIFSTARKVTGQWIKNPTTAAAVFSTLTSVYNNLDKLTNKETFTNGLGNVLYDDAKAVAFTKSCQKLGGPATMMACDVLDVAKSFVEGNEDATCDKAAKVAVKWGWCAVGYLICGPWGGYVLYTLVEVSV